MGSRLGGQRPGAEGVTSDQIPLQEYSILRPILFYETGIHWIVNSSDGLLAVSEGTAADTGSMQTIHLNGQSQ